MSAFYESVVTIASSFCNNVFTSPTNSRYIGVGALHCVVIWDMLEQVEVAVLPGKTDMAFVTRIAANPNGRELAVGYENGVIAIYDLHKKKAVCEFAAHHSAVTCMQYDGEGDFLVSGSKDTQVVVLDVVAKTVKARLTGHRAAITNVLFTDNCVISTSKDALVKFWDVETNQCLKTLGGDPNDQISSAVLCRDNRYLVTGNQYKELKVYELKWTADAANADEVLQCHLVCSETLVARGRLVGLSTYGDVLACYTDRGLLSLYSLRTRTEDSCPSESKEVKAQRKKLAKLIKRGKVAADYSAEVPTERQSSSTASIHHLASLKMDAKVVSTSLRQFADGRELRAAVTLADNSVQLVGFEFSEDYKLVARTLSRIA
ncbi:WD repeat-containing protein 3-like isoform X1 [Spodoptera frugiperda]|uniref:WD repeat-containing protein 3-like isoform X1 n=1 Tax=Spodoptera frugiperda TaxID=7108 RepID=A0A9R0DPC0_SPOFR|nr:WD repeat-containing protein 3-like isoform X2 [Spodoptera frugiperda]XP_050550881.1 WD repeat-containing protein 3-like isoform X1 [Spodoptera frugiperda]XP_050550882.1 WD repeat-containing protein 3-like isoform X4 [Spodoptera frugiperda]XP_050550884.1 WD repeat-containing protein 3-like isoform X6 [Spodoptera frugiperda]XP_050550885.1 WD repeat-containing protein 3-like isoform X7 [Spodoptera frugiperda]XP_050550886.1 WD repeat-containing protein 3-like isoform X8 [Spodoptera frugiperda]